MLLQNPKGDIIDDISYNVRHYSSQVNTVSFIRDCKFKGEYRATFEIDKIVEVSLEFSVKREIFNEITLWVCTVTK